MLQTSRPLTQANKAKVGTEDSNGHISDEDEGGKGSYGSILDEVEESPNSGPGLGLGLVAPSLPSVRKDNQFEDAEEDLSDLPRAKEAEKAAAPLRPKPKLPVLGGAKRNRGGGPVKIMLPTLDKYSHEEDEDDNEPG